MKSDYVDAKTMEHLLALLMPENRAAIECSMRYGMRIGDVLSLEREQVAKLNFSYKEQKSGKSRRIRMSKSFADQLLSLGDLSSRFVFPSRLDTLKHRSRQAVYKDIRRAAKAFRLPQHVSPHSARKLYAVNAYKRTGNMKQVQHLLNHSSEAVTMLYALADQITARELEKKKKKKGGV